MLKTPGLLRYLNPWRVVSSQNKTPFTKPILIVLPDDIKTHLMSVTWCCQLSAWLLEWQDMTESAIENEGMKRLYTRKIFETDNGGELPSHLASFICFLF